MRERNVDRNKIKTVYDKSNDWFDWFWLFAVYNENTYVSQLNQSLNGFYDFTSL